jgi:hypothetical protein
MIKLLPIGTFALGLAAGAWWGHHVPAESPASSIASARVLPGPQLENSYVHTAGGGSEATCAAFRHELAQALEHNKGPQAPPTAEEPAPESAQAVSARQSAQADIDALVTGSLCGDEQRDEFHRKLAALPPEQQKLALQKLVLAFNSGALKAQTNGPPL